MSFNVTSAKLTGNPSKSGWSQVHDFVPEDPEKRKLRGHLYAVISTSRAPSDIDAVAVGRELLLRLHEEYFGDMKASSFNALRAAVEKVSGEFSSELGQIEIAAVCLVDSLVYSAAVGGGQVAIFRKGMLANILESKKETVSVSGHPQEEDVLVAGTREFFDAISHGVLKAAVEGKSPEETAETLAPSVHSKEQGRMGVVFLKFKKTLEDVVPEEAAAPPQFTSRLSSISSQIRGAKFISNLTNRLPDRKIRVRVQEELQASSQKRKVSISVGIVLLALLAISIGFGMRQKRQKDYKARYETELQQAMHEFEEAVEIFSLNPQRSRELFKQSRAKIGVLQGQGVEDPALSVLEENLKQKEGEILGEYRQGAELFVDLSLLSSGFSADKVATSEDKIYVLDINGKKVAEVSLDTKRSEVVAGPSQIDEANGLAAYSGRVFILNKDGILEIDKGVVVEKGWESEALVYVYAGNIYILDKGASFIWRYSGTESGFALGRSWLTEGVEPDLGSISVWAIDGSIWLLSETGRVFKFSSGNQIDFNIRGVSPELLRVDAIYTNEDLEYFYALDKEAGRVVVLEKDGEYKAQYFTDSVKEAKAIVVSEKEAKLILITNDKLLSVDLKLL
jgi:hypothetical protein